MKSKGNRELASNLAKELAKKASGSSIAITVLETVLKFRRNQVEANLTDFFTKIARGEDVWEEGRFHEKIAEEGSLRDFAELVEAVAREHENEKNDVYSNLYTAFVDNRVTDPVLRRHLIHCAREMTAAETSLCMEIYREWNRAPDEDSLYQAVLHKYEADESMSGRLTMAKLNQLGFVEVQTGSLDGRLRFRPLNTLAIFVREAFALDDDGQEIQWQ